MKTASFISVVMATYNDADCLAESIESVLVQDYDHFELIVVNDGSPDPRTREILDLYSRQDRRLRIIHKKNQGLTKALIDGCNEAKGKYIARIDAGDAMAKSRLRLQSDFLDAHSDVVFVSSWSDYFGPDWEWLYTVKGRHTGRNGIDIAKTILKNKHFDGPTCHPSVMLRRDVYEAVGGYRWQFYYAQDADLWARLAERGKFHILPEPLYRVRVFPASISHNHREDQIATYGFICQAAEARKRGEDEALFLGAAARIRPDRTLKVSAKFRKLRTNGSYFIAEALRRNHDPRCRRYFFSCLKENPFNLKAFYRLVSALGIRGAGDEP